MRRLPMLLLAMAATGCTLLEPAQERYVVFFQEWSAQIDDGARAVIGGAAAFAQRHPDDVLMVVGYADPEGSAQANVDISGLRARVVSDLLAADGVSPARIQRQAVGSVGFASTSQESRRVEILVRAP